MCLTLRTDKQPLKWKTTFSTSDTNFDLSFHRAECQGLMDLNYTDVKLDLSEFILKGRREGAQMVFGSVTEV